MGRDVVAQYLYSVGPGRRNDLGTTTLALVVWWGDRKHQILQERNARMRAGGVGR